MNELNEIENSLYSAMESLKRIARDKNKHLYERWKAGGFLVDTNIMSDYPNAQEVIEDLQNENEDDSDDEFDYPEE
jgi:hypothetical protein